MTPSEIIAKINNAIKLEDVIDLSNFKSEYSVLIKKIHPDICADPGAADATLKLNNWKHAYESGKAYKDDSGEFTTNGYWVKYDEGQDCVKRSFSFYQKLMSLNTAADKHFQQYIPAKADGNKLIFAKRSIPLTNLVLPQEHVNWILNRMLEYIAYLSQTGYMHGGLNPESVFIVPETHGIQICSFYHAVSVGQKMSTISGAYKHWYPTEVFSQKIASPAVDMELAKRMAIYLLGEPSGNAVRLRKTHNEEFINFILTRHDNAYECLTSYKTFLEKNFKKQFHILNL